MINKLSVFCGWKAARGINKQIHSMVRRSQTKMANLNWILWFYYCMEIDRNEISRTWTNSLEVHQIISQECRLMRGNQLTCSIYQRTYFGGELKHRKKREFTSGGDKLPNISSASLYIEMTRNRLLPNHITAIRPCSSLWRPHHETVLRPRCRLPL